MRRIFFWLALFGGALIATAVSAGRFDGPL